VRPAMGDAKPEEKLPFMEPTPEMEAMMKKMNYGLIKVRPLKKLFAAAVPLRNRVPALARPLRACPALCVRGGAVSVADRDCAPVRPTFN